MSEFDHLLDQARDILRQQTRVSYRGLARRLDIDLVDIEAIRDELVDAEQVARDEAGKVLVWQSAPNASESLRSSIPANSYTPKHLADKILNNRSALEGEKKQVTVLFADVKGSQDLAEELGAEDWHEVLDRFFSILSEGIHRFEGTVNQYTGDGVMALFGAPIAHEDHALRACHAALLLKSTLRRFADELRLRRGVNLSVRVGLNSGEVVVGKIGDDLRMDYTAQGHTVGLAARMESIAEPGRVYLTEYTAARVKGYFDLRDLGEMEIKGSRQPLQVYALEGLGEQQTRLDISRARGLSRFVGRQRESALLDDALQRATEGHGQVVTVVGNGGIGKSRLCFEFCERARASGAEVHQGTAVPYGAAMPYFPLISLLKHYFGISDHDESAEARRKVAGTLALADHECKDALFLVTDFLGIAADGHDSEIPPELRMERLFDLLLQLLPGCSNPCILLIEDMQWIDPATEVFMQRLIEYIPTSRCVLLINTRPEYHSEWLHRSVDVEIPVTALGEAEMSELTADLMGEDASLNELRTDMGRRAGGNPFFVEEAVRSLAEAGHLEGRPGAYRLVQPLEKLLIPDSVHAILTARIDRLGDNEKDVLQRAAVIGKTFKASLLAAVCECVPDNLAEPLENLQESGFINRQDLDDDDPEYAFCHPLTQEVAYKSQLRERRAGIHGQLAKTLENDVSLDDLPDERSVMLAHHWSRARQPVKAAQWLLKAGAWSGLRDMHAALDHFQQAMAVIDGVQKVTPETKHLAISARAGIMRMSNLGGLESPEYFESIYNQGFAMAVESGDEYGRAELLLSNGIRMLNLGNTDQAMQSINESIAICNEIGESELLSRFRIPILLAHYASGHLKQGLAVLKNSGRGGWETAEISEENFGGRAFRAVFLTYMGDLDTAWKDMTAAIDFAMKSDRRISWMYANRVEFGDLAGRHDQLMRDAQLSINYAEEYGAPMFREIAHRSLAVAHIHNGDYQSALDVLELSADLVASGEPAHQFESIHLALIAQARHGLGHSEEAVQLIHRAVTCAQNNNLRIWSCRVLLMQADMLLDQQGAAAADQVRQALQRVMALVDETGAIIFRPLARCLLARLAGITGDTEEQRAALTAALQEFQQFGAEGRVAAVSHDLQALERKAG